MGTFSIWHWLIVLAIVLLLFGRGRIPSLMGDLAKGIKSFKSGMKEDPESPKKIDSDATATADKASVEKDEAAQS
ncbi:MAG: twin-arginine translocase TatA/TatE family subunit [Alphaproteobacteria bacterium]